MASCKQKAAKQHRRLAAFDRRRRARIGGGSMAHWLVQVVYAQLGWHRGRTTRRQHAGRRQHEANSEPTGKRHRSHGVKGARRLVCQRRGSGGREGGGGGGGGAVNLLADATKLIKFSSCMPVRQCAVMAASMAHARVANPLYFP
eukprot:SAG31_NODE_1385_length_8573_cov_27.673118_1_plen_145_part_00